MRRRIAVAWALAMVGVMALAGAGSAQVTKGKTRPATTKQLMAGWIGPTCSALGKDLQTAPADDKAWEALATKAAVLNESGHTLMEDGRCPDATWAGACKTLQDCSAVMVTKAGAKDYAGMKDAFTAFTQGCKSCHTAHKK